MVLFVARSISFCRSALPRFRYTRGVDSRRKTVRRRFRDRKGQRQTGAVPAEKTHDGSHPSLRSQPVSRRHTGCKTRADKGFGITVEDVYDVYVLIQVEPDRMVNVDLLLSIRLQQTCKMALVITTSTVPFLIAALHLYWGHGGNWPGADRQDLLDRFSVAGIGSITRPPLRFASTCRAARRASEAPRPRFP